jgi:ubiquinone/menaquinone biosynthesis C-methylase UbiE
MLNLQGPAESLKTLMTTRSPNPPYFDVLLARIAAGDRDAVTAFGRHVHWGCWDQPDAATGTAADYQQAAERLCERVVEAAEIEHRQRVLDVGCGFGGTIASLNDRFDQLTMTGINIDPRQLQRAAELLTPRGGNTIDWIAADAADLPLPERSCDRVLAVECIFHFNRGRFLTEAARVLRAGGRLTISDFVPEPRTAAFMADADFAGGEAIRWTYGNVDMTCTLPRYHQLAAACGLTLTTVADITEQTLPTYEFLQRGAAQWHDRDHAELFLKATGWLEKASRKGMIQYLIISFQR